MAARADFRAFAILAVLLALLLLLRSKGGDLVLQGEDIDMTLAPIPDTVLPSILIARGGRKEVTDAMCDCDGTPIVNNPQVYLGQEETGPQVTTVYTFAVPRYSDGLYHT
jgi:hypothetical protein